jgi:hypothetical protein
MKTIAMAVALLYGVATATPSWMSAPTSMQYHTMSQLTPQEDAGKTESGHQLISNVANLGCEKSADNLAGDNSCPNDRGNGAIYTDCQQTGKGVDEVHLLPSVEFPLAYTVATCIGQTMAKAYYGGY